ncbi:MAG: HAD family hydrolase [Bordetella sp.]|nr:MAG: HAD family hydrolase [Bordetella sp.]
MKQHLALFDLDHTLIPIDSDYQWVNFLAQKGKIGDNPKKIKLQNDYLMKEYNKGLLTVEKSTEFMLQFLAKNSPYELAEWHEDFMKYIIRPSIRKEAIDLVKTHLETNGLCAIVTSTNSFVTEPIARAFGIHNLIATIPEYFLGQYTGKVHGTPSFREGKVIRVKEWLNSIGRKFSDFSESFFYSDSINDIPLLEIVTRPIATNPSPNLRVIAKNQGWEILDLFNNLKDD